MFFDEYILLGSTEDAIDLWDSLFLSGLDQAVEHEFFHLAPQHAATHKPGVDFPSTCIYQAAEDNSYQSVITHAVGQMKGCRPTSSVDGQRAHLCLRVAAGCKVELIRLVS